MKIGFIGLGNMASAMIGGMLEKGVTTKEDILGYARTSGSREKAAQDYGIEIAKDNKDVAARAEVLFLAVKPIAMDGVLEEIRGAIRANTLIVSIAAGRSIEYFKSGLGDSNAKIVRCMPNTPALVGEGCTGIAFGEYITDDEKKTIMTLVSSFGLAKEVPERLMNVVVGVSGSSPAYVFMFIEAMADAAVAGGMPRAQAYEFAAQAVLGSAKMVLETGKHPGELKDMVCSPAGTTIQAVKVLEEKGFRAAVIDACEACINAKV